MKTQVSLSPLLDYIQDFEAMFTKEDFNTLLEYQKWDHAIELTPGSKPKLSKMYLLSLAEQTELNGFLEENLCMGCIYPLRSPIAVLVFFIKKKDSSLYLVQNYWALNVITIKNKYLLPFIFELVFQLHREKYFIKLDISWGFNNVYIKSGDKWKATF